MVAGLGLGWPWEEREAGLRAGGPLLTGCASCLCLACGRGWLVGRDLRGARAPESWLKEPLAESPAEPLRRGEVAGDGPRRVRRGILDCVDSGARLVLPAAVLGRVRELSGHHCCKSGRECVVCSTRSGPYVLAHYHKPYSINTTQYTLIKKHSSSNTHQINIKYFNRILNIFRFAYDCVPDSVITSAC